MANVSIATFKAAIAAAPPLQLVGAAVVGGLICGAIGYGIYKVIVHTKNAWTQAKLLKKVKKHETSLNEFNKKHQQEMEKIKKIDTLCKGRMAEASRVAELNTRMSDFFKEEAEFLEKKNQEGFIIDAQVDELIRKHKEDKQLLIEAGYELMSSDKIKNLVQTSPKLRADIKEAIKRVDFIRAEVGSGLDDFAKDLRDKAKGDLQEQDSEESHMLQLLEYFTTTMIKEDAYVPPSGKGSVPPVQTQLYEALQHCPCGKAHSGKWYHPGDNRVNTFRGTDKEEVVADGKGRWMCISCRIPMKIEDMVFSCDDHRHVYKSLSLDTSSISEITPTDSTASSICSK